MRIGLGLHITGLRAGGGEAPFTPADLFASGEQGAWYEPSPSTCFTDTGGTTAASVGDPVAHINDSSGNGNHATQATLASRPILRQTGGGLYYLGFDGVDDFFDLTYPVSQRSSDMTMVMGVEQNPAVTSTQTFITSRDGNNTPFVTSYDNTTSTVTDGFSGAPTHHVNNGVDLSSRNSIFNALNTNAPVVYEARSFSMTTSEWAATISPVTFGGYRGGNLTPGIDMYNLLILANHTAGQITSARNWTADLIGATLL